MSKDTKLIRGQIRQVLKELLPELLTQELIQSINKELQAETADKLRAIQKDVQVVLERVDERSKDIQSYLVRATTVGTNELTNLNVTTPEFKNGQ